MQAFRGVLAAVILGAVAHLSASGRDIDPLTTPVTDYNNHYHGERPLGYLFVRPYYDDNFLYGYFDHIYGRGPVLTLGNRTLLPGFRGYGMFGSPGYGAGLRPTSVIDLSRYRWRGGCFRPGSSIGRERLDADPRSCPP
jgi:hypothetical protein